MTDVACTELTLVDITEDVLKNYSIHNYTFIMFNNIRIIFFKPKVIECFYFWIDF